MTGSSINVARDFTPFPGGRYKKNGKGSGEEFRQRFLIPALERKELLVVELDGADGYPPSFLEEAFGGLIRLGYSRDDVARLINIQAGPAYESYVLLINQYLDKAASAS